MQLFHSNDIRDGLIFLDKEEARHATQVLRHRAGDTLHVVDGAGNRYETCIVEANKKSCILRIEQQEFFGPRAAFSLHLAVAPTKNISRLEWMLEKATEIGLDSFTPILCEHSERRNVRIDRLEKVVLSAMKQSLKAWLPQINPLVKFEDFITQGIPAGTKSYICHLGPESKGPLKDNYHAGRDVVIMIGPEGDFSPNEITMALEAGYTGVTLGKERLRTETAGLVACHTLNLLQT